ncbi:hypothetical protein Ppa06_57400 [Planomonospora parontospora subsp. parontospora]|uniref:Uncharacterized protein n=2 Tax=Planomonospora parontospora TaxID=58119 RepID=A0AA37BM90_9ACTN|nr:hypothetical protein [Planomonospora parontospora]GGK90861.1 hypothetical protein GCM10010126_57910 [Planomonospora parontospora]GII11942.1 hypothetical protein Ppa06_57400 [Planomonospora parontospora subsp. parontospora]
MSFTPDAEDLITYSVCDGPDGCGAEAGQPCHGYCIATFSGEPVSGAVDGFGLVHSDADPGL